MWCLPIGDPATAITTVLPGIHPGDMVCPGAFRSRTDDVAEPQGGHGAAVQKALGQVGAGEMTLLSPAS